MADLMIGIILIAAVGAVIWRKDGIKKWGNPAAEDAAAAAG